MTTASGPGRVSVWEQARLLAALEAIAITLWLLPASVHIVSWPASGPVRLALLAPMWQLLLWMSAGVAAHGVLLLAGRAAAASRMLSAFVVLWAGVVPYAPWVADRLPLLLVLAGPVQWLLVAAVAASTCMRFEVAAAVVSRIATLGRRTVFATSLAVYVGFGLWTATTNGLGGDEPHYLVITHSLLHDADLQIENNHQRGDYRAFFRGVLRPDYMQRGKNGQIYSIHAPGLPALLLPVYAVAGYLGAVALIGLIAALTALAVFDLAELLAGRTVAVLTWLAVCLTVPFIPHSWAIFPEMPGALLVSWAALWLLQPVEQRTAARWLLCGLALAWLPWLHTKFVVFLAVFSLGLGLRLLKQPAKLFALGTPIALSCGAWLYSFYVLYGRFDPEAPYGAYSSIYVLTGNIPHGLLGLFFDQKFGLLFYSPLYLVAVAGAWIGLREARLRFASAILLLTIAVFVGTTARLYMFWGGSSAPARFFVPVLPCLAPFVALGIARAQSAWSRALVGLWLAIGLGVAAVALVEPARLLLFSDPHGRSKFLELLQAGSPLALVVPTFTDPDWRAHVAPLAAWLVAALASGAVVVAWSRVRRVSSWTLAGWAAATFLLLGAALTGRPAVAVREATAQRGSLDVLWRFDRTRHRTLDYSTLARVTPERLRQFTTIHVRPDVPADARAPFEAGPLNLPPGRFEASVWFSSSRPREGEVSIAAPRATFGRVAGSLGNPARFEVSVPAAARRVVVRVPDLQIARAITDVQLAPIDVVPPSQRDPRPVRMIESLAGSVGRYLVYTDGEAYPEMGTFWTRGTAATTVLVTPAGASRMTLTLSTGPMAGLVTVTLGGRTQQVSMPGSQEQIVTLDVPAGPGPVPLTIRSSVMFRPAQVNPSVNDMRGLGCQVRIALE